MPGILLITGSTGIAEAAALAARRDGWKVFVVAKEQADFVADLCDEDAVAQAFQACIEKLGGLSAVFNVAGSSGRRFGDGPVHECTLAGWEATFSANSRLAFLVSRAAVRHWLGTKTPGALLNIASVLAFSPEPTHFATHAYAAAKAATISMSHVMAAQYAANGIRVNVLAPALVRTPMSQRAQADPKIGAFIEHKQPLSHGFLEAADIAETALFLLSDKARHITGQVITVDGGWTL
jgi:NAD(P)-dependent dehydrogenase (short-subunit alcohol dehydrogenase family)